MNSLRKRIAIALVLVGGMLVGGIAGATPITMNFDGLTPGSSVHNYYDGGCTTRAGLFGPRSCGGPDYGVVWKGASVQNSPVHQPTGPNYMGPSGYGGFLTSSATLNIADGFDTGLSFYYSALIGGDVRIFSGIDGTGSLLTSEELPAPGNQCGNFPCWDFVDLSFSGSAKSVIFSGFLGLIGFDNVTLGAAQVNPVPEPAALGMFGLGVLLIGLFAGMRRRAHQS